jgi:hypothetical protein
MTLSTARAVADDDDLVNAAGFEPGAVPFGFSTGTLEGQFNPPGEGQVVSPGAWLKSPNDVTNTSTAIVQAAIFAPGGGSQAVEVFRASGDDARWAVPVNALGYPDYPNPFPPEPAQPCLCLSWDMRVSQTTGPDDTFGPFFGVEAYDDDAIVIGLLGSLGVDATTGDVLYQAADTGAFTETGSTVSFDDWNHFQMKLDYSTKDYEIFLNYVSLGTIGFVDENNVPGGLVRFTDGNISALAAMGDAASLALTGTAHFDNFLIREGSCPIPEPMTGTLVLLAATTHLLVYRPRRRMAGTRGQV